jgi:hypothetical protein
MRFNRSMLLAASATALLSLPAVSLAADNQDKNQRPEVQHNGQQAGPQHDAKPQQQPNPQQQSRPQQQAGPQQQFSPQQQPNPQQQSRPQQRVGSQQQQQQFSPQQQPNPQQQSRPQRQAGSQQQQQQFRPEQQAGPQQQFSQQQQTGQTGGSRRAVATHDVQESNQWRSVHSNWNSNTVWNRNPNWWRGNASFRNYTGARVNFFYAPGFGYYSVPQEYWGRSWNTGGYLPLFFLRYAVNDYQDYGLPQPPYGCSWVWLDTSVLLVDRSDGYILDEIGNVW